MKTGSDYGLARSLKIDPRAILAARGLADGIPVDVREALTGIDHRGLGLLVTGMRHAAGHRSLRP